MKANELIRTASASFGPDALKVIGQAFDAAWASTAGNFTDGASAQSARLQLADIILSIADDGSRDAEAIKLRALDALRDDYGSRAV
jgi:hypothetical protein